MIVNYFDHLKTCNPFMQKDAVITVLLSSVVQLRQLQIRLAIFSYRYR
jgi:hypothetical protein